TPLLGPLRRRVRMGATARGVREDLPAADVGCGVGGCGNDARALRAGGGESRVERGRASRGGGADQRTTRDRRAQTKPRRPPREVGARAPVSHGTPTRSEAATGSRVPG